MAVCKAMGARRILAVDVSQGRLDFAKQYAATDIHLASPMYEGEERGAYSQRHVSPTPPRGTIYSHRRPDEVGGNDLRQIRSE